MTLGEVSPEYSQVEQYYVHQVNQMEDEIKTIDIVSNEDQNEMLMDELRDMDKMYEELQEDLKANPNDERVINAMIEHYQRKDLPQLLHNLDQPIRFEECRWIGHGRPGGHEIKARHAGALDNPLHRHITIVQQSSEAVTIRRSIEYLGDSWATQVSVHNEHSFFSRRCNRS